ncbi:MAG: hypothetical protein J7497_08270 [Chitinophagaceae bacterium]|nr:hypothetical protein [Chitinophagaceae bacterium]
MTMEEFHQLDEAEQMSAIMQFGHLLAQSSGDNKRVFLYHLDTFYVSATYLQPGDQLLEIKCFLEADQHCPHHRKHLTMINPAERKVTMPDNF